MTNMLQLDNSFANISQFQFAQSHRQKFYFYRENSPINEFKALMRKSSVLWKHATLTKRQTEMLWKMPKWGDFIAK